MTSFSPEPNYLDWETERLEKYSNDLQESINRRTIHGIDRKVKKKIDRILENRKEYGNQFFDELLDK